MTAEPDINLSENGPIGKAKTGRKPGPLDWSKSSVPDHRCTAHKKNGEQCNNPSIRGGRVCKFHGGNSPAVKARARQRLEEAADRMAKKLLGLAENAVSEGVQLAAVKDALDRGGVQAKTAVSVEVSAKPFELVFEAVSAGPREPALAIESESAAIESESEDDEIVGEVDDDVIDDYPSGFQQELEQDCRGSDDVVDVEVVADEGYTDAESRSSAGTTTPGDPVSSSSVELGAISQVSGGLLSMSDAIESAAYLREREAARLREMRRR